MITYKALVLRPNHFYRLTGHTEKEFDYILDKFKSAHEEKLREKQFDPKRKRAIGAGRPSHLLTLEDKLLFILIYVRMYPLLFLHGIMFNLSESNACFWVHEYLLILDKALGFAHKKPLRPRGRNLEELIAEFPELVELGMWGHSMGGFITLRSMVVDPDIKVGVIWAGVVASYSDLINNWRRGTFTPPTTIPTRALGWRSQLISKYGTPEKNPEFWNSISANSFLKDLNGRPIQLHHGTSDHSVPLLFSEILKTQMDKAKQKSELYIYEGDDHNIANNFNIAAQRSIEFFDKYLKTPLR